MYTGRCSLEYLASSYLANSTLRLLRMQSCLQESGADELNSHIRLFAQGYACSALSGETGPTHSPPEPGPRVRITSELSTLLRALSTYASIY